MSNMTEQLTMKQMKLAGMVEQDAKLAVVAINSFVTAFELLRKTA